MALMNMMNRSEPTLKPRETDSSSGFGEDRQSLNLTLTVRVANYFSIKQRLLLENIYIRKILNKV